MAGAYRQLPNQLTLLRLVLAGVFFVVLNQYRYPTDSLGEAVWLWSAIALFTLAAATDWLDGYLARKWNVESTFGRIMDPFCDKVLVLGAFIYLAGPRFVDPHAVELDTFLMRLSGGTKDGVLGFTMITGVYPWMVALMLARELLVTGIRGELEGQGVKFGANIWGKLKAVLQLVGIPAILVIVWLDPGRDGHAWLRTVQTSLVYAIIISTVLSGIPYITRARAALKKARPDASM